MSHSTKQTTRHSINVMTFKKVTGGCSRWKEINQMQWVESDYNVDQKKKKKVSERLGDFKH